VRKRLQRAEAGLRAGPHASLGLPAYLQATSPLRRYQDLVIHRQLAAHLDGVPPPYDADAMQRILGTTELAERNARLAERNRAEFWGLRYLEARAGQWLEACVVEVDPRTVVQLAETLREQPMPGLRGVEPGQQVRVRVERVVPRAGLLILRS
jgi:exoribonuclease-2